MSVLHDGNGFISFNGERPNAIFYTLPAWPSDCVGVWPAADDFSGGALAASHRDPYWIASDGGVWHTTQYGGGSGIFADAFERTAGGKVRPANGNGGEILWRECCTPFQRVEVDITVHGLGMNGLAAHFETDGAPDAGQPQIFARLNTYNAAGRVQLYSRYADTSGPGGAPDIYELIAESADGVIVDGGTYRLGLQCVYDQITVFLDGVEILSGSSVVGFSGTKAGLLESTIGDSATWEFANFTGVTPEGAPPPPAPSLSGSSGFQIEVRAAMTDADSRWPALRFTAADPAVFWEMGFVTGESNLELVGLYQEFGSVRYEHAMSSTLEYGEEVRFNIAVDLIGGIVLAGSTYGGTASHSLPDLVGIAPARAYIIGSAEPGTNLLVNRADIRLYYPAT